MGLFGDILTPLKDAGEAAFDAVTGSSPSPAAPAAPVPTVHGRPPSARPVSSWTAPDASGSGQISVHRDVLRSVARSMQSDVKDMDTAVAAARTASGDAGSIRGWSTGSAFSGNASNACHAIAQAGAHVGNAQQAASKNVADCASTYDAAESDNQQAISGVGTQPNAAGSWGPMAGTSAAVPATSASSSAAMTPIDVKTHGVAESDVAGMTAAEIMEILHGLPSGEVAAAGAAHTRLGSTLEQIATRVTQHAHTLAQSWTGSAAQAAMVRFQTLHGQTATLAQQATQTGAVLSWLGNEVLPKFKALPDPTPASPMATDAQTGAAVGEQVAGPEGAVVGSVGGTIVGAVSGLFGGNAQAQAQANQTAQQYLKALNGHLVQANQALPSPVGGSNIGWDSGGPGAVSPSGGSRSGAGAAAPTSGYPGGGAGSGAGTGGPGSGAGGMAGVPKVGSVPGAGGSGAGLSTAPVSGHGGASGGGSLPSATGSLQGVPVTTGGSPPPSLGPATGPPAPGPVGPGSPPPNMPGLGLPVPGPASGGAAGGLGVGDEFSADAVPGGGIPGGAAGGEGIAGVPESGLTVQGAVGQGAAVQGTVADTAVGTPAASDGLLAAGAEGQADYGMTGFPMTGSGAAQQEKERRRKAWLGEDADTWGLPSDYVPPVIEGGG